MAQRSPRGWKLLPNLFTPHKDHNLIVPDRCWPAAELQRWGGGGRIGEILTIASLERGEREEVVLLMHVGLQAGQNLGHPHVHIFEALTAQPLAHGDLLGYANNEAVRVFEEEDWIVAAGGARAGECLIVPREPRPFNEKIDSLASCMSRLVDLGNERFRSKEGLPPAYGLVVRFASGGALRYVDYCPTLHQWGVCEFVIPVLEGTPYVLPWPHEITAAYLRS